MSDTIRAHRKVNLAATTRDSKDPANSPPFDANGELAEPDASAYLVGKQAGWRLARQWLEGLGWGRLSVLMAEVDPDTATRAGRPNTPYADAIRARRFPGSAGVAATSTGYVPAGVNLGPEFEPLPPIVERTVTVPPVTPAEVISEAMRGERDDAVRAAAAAARGLFDEAMKAADNASAAGDRVADAVAVKAQCGTPVGAVGPCTRPVGHFGGHQVVLAERTIVDGYSASPGDTISYPDSERVNRPPSARESALFDVGDTVRVFHWNPTKTIRHEQDGTIWRRQYVLLGKARAGWHYDVQIGGLTQETEHDWTIARMIIDVPENRIEGRRVNA